MDGAQAGLGEADPRAQGRVRHPPRATAATLPAPSPPRPATASSYQATRPSRTAARPESASASVNGFARTETYDSRSWVRASMPLPAIRSGGQLPSRSGSRTATCATNASSRNDFLKPPGPRTLSTAFLVASLPVPAVVGTATNGIAGPRYGSSAPIPSRWSMTELPGISSPATALAVSSTLPPPTPRTTSTGALLPLPGAARPAEPARTRATISSTSAGEGSPDTPSTATSTPLDSSAPRSRAQSADSVKPGRRTTTSALVP